MEELIGQAIIWVLVVAVFIGVGVAIGGLFEEPETDVQRAAALGAAEAAWGR